MAALGRGLILAVVAACAFSGLAGAAEQTVIEFWWGGAGSVEEMRAIVEAFHQTYPAIRVNMTDQGSIGIRGAGLDKLKTSVAAGIPPDLAYLDATGVMGLALADDLLVPLNELLDDEFLNAIPYLDAPRSYVVAQGKHYGLQFRTDSRGLYYNQDHFLEVGLDMNAGPQDIDELDVYAQRMTRWAADGGIERLGFAPRGNNFGLGLGWFWVFGGEVFDSDSLLPTFTGNPAHLRALEWILSYADLYGAAASVSNPKFVSGEVSMIIQSTTSLAPLKQQTPDLNWSVSHIPYPPEGKRTTLSTGYAFVIPRGARLSEGLATFLRFLARKETQMTWYRLTEQPPARVDAVLELIQAGEVADPRVVVMWELMPVAEGYPPLFASHVIVPLEENLNRMRARQITPHQVLEDLQRTLEPEFRRLLRREQ